jgi:hypothetical protein
MPQKKGNYTPNNPLDTLSWNLYEGEEILKDTYDLQRKAITKYELQKMMDSIEAKIEEIMDTKMDGLKGEIMEGLKKLLIERPPESDNVSHEIHDEDTRNMNQDLRKSSLGLNNNHFNKIDMKNFDGKDPITWILQMEQFFDLHGIHKLHPYI